MIHLINHTDQVVSGSFPTNVDSKPPHASGVTKQWSYVLGQPSGLDTFNVDVRVTLQPHERLTIDLSQASPSFYELPPPGDCARYLGGVPVRFAGVRMAKLPTEVNGAAYDLHYVARIKEMLVVHLWLHWNPAQPGWCPGKLMVVASNPNSPDLIAMIPAGGFKLQVGESIVSIPGLPPNPDIMQVGDWLATTQGRAVPITVAWLELCSEQDKIAAFAWANQLIGIRGIEKLYADGNPLLPDGFDALDWTNKLLPTVIERQHDWWGSPLDPAMDSTSPGAQGAQSFVGGPVAADPSAACVFHIAALDMSWPMMHLEADGSTLDWRQHNGLRLYMGGINFALSDETLGKTRNPSMTENHGYQGPHIEHWFDRTLTVGGVLMGDPATQMLLEAHAINLLFDWPVDPPGDYTFPARAEGWLGMLVAELYRGLKNRDLAEAVAQRFRDLTDRLIIPRMLPKDRWWSWTTDPRIGASEDMRRSSPWQCEVMAVGMDLGGAATGHQPARELALHMAKVLLERAWTQFEGRWTSRDVVNEDFSDTGLRPETGKPYVGAYDFFGMKACDVMLRHDPSHQQAGEIWRQRRRESTTLEQLAWFVPGVKTAT